MENNNITNGTSTTSNSYLWNYNTAYCTYRLPCGYCTRLNKECTMNWSMPSWWYQTGPTCTATTTTISNS